MDKKILFLMGVLAVLILLAGCQPQPQVPDEEAFAQLEELSDEELDAALSEDSAVAGQAYARFPAASVQRIKQARKVVNTFSWLRCDDSDGGKNYPVKGVVAAKYTYGGKSGEKQLEDFCLSDTKLQEYYCNGNTYSRATTDCEFGCEDGACKESGSTVAAGDEDTSAQGTGAAPTPEPEKEPGNQMVDVVDQTVCGDGVVQGVEECDDGASNGVVCSPVYDAECGYCNNDCKTVVVKGGFCGDGIRQFETEGCEDGNNKDGDGCSATCKVEQRPDLSLFSANYSLVYNATSGKDDVVVKVTVLNSGMVGTVNGFYTKFNASFPKASGLADTSLFIYSQPLPAFGTALAIGKYSPYGEGKTACPGTHQVNITVDWFGQVKEKNENNNGLMLKVNC